MYPQAYINKFKIYFLTFVLFAVIGVNALCPDDRVTIYELYIDFGNDNVFLHEITKLKWYCDERVKFITKRENVKAYCLKRESITE